MSHPTMLSIEISYFHGMVRPDLLGIRTFLPSKRSGGVPTALEKMFVREAGFQFFYPEKPLFYRKFISLIISYLCKFISPVPLTKFAPRKKSPNVLEAR